MGRIKVWTKQSESIVDDLERDGRYIAKREYMMRDLDEHAYLVFEVYDWLAKHSPSRDKKPEDSQYPIWVSLKEEATMLASDGMVILELEIEEDLLTKINIDKWGCILNYSYIPKDLEDASRHRKLLEDYGIAGDAKAYMSSFYPQIKREIVDSWSRLFDDSIVVGNGQVYGNLWEVKREWVKKIIK